MSTLHFEKLSQFDRVAEPVTVSIPFGQGKLTDPDQFAIEDDGRAAAFPAARPGPLVRRQRQVAAGPLSA